MLKNLFIALFIVVLFLSLGTVRAQTTNSQAVKHVLQDWHTCGLSSSSAVFKAPSGTISYYDFVSQLPNYYRKDGGLDFFSSYDKETNSFRMAPAVAFVLNGFTPIEIGSDHSGRRGLVYISIRADECENLEMNLGGRKIRVGRLAAHLMFRGTKGALPPDEIHTVLGDWLVSNIVRKAADFNDSRQFIVIARPIGMDSRSTGELMDRMNIDFEIESYYIPEKN